MIDTRLKVLDDVVGHEHGDTALPTMLVRGAHRPPQINLGDHVIDGVMDEHSVEGSVETHRSHITLDVLAFRIQLAGDGQHLIGEIDKGHLELTLEMEGVVAAAAPKLENCSSRRVGGAEQ
jgi:hypothetical protein